MDIAHITQTYKWLAYVSGSVQRYFYVYDEIMIEKERINKYD